MNWDHNLKVDLITGKSGSGKSTLYLSKLVAWRARWKFVFDPDREFSRKCGVPSCYTVEELDAAVASQRPAAFCPARMFPVDSQPDNKAFAFFTLYTVRVSQRLRGVKLFACDEIWKYCPKFTPPSGYREMLNAGRREEIDQLYICQRVAQVCEDLKTQLSEVTTFKHTAKNALEWLEEMGFDPQQVKALAYPGGRITLDVNRDEIISHHANGNVPSNAKRNLPDATGARNRRARVER